MRVVGVKRALQCLTKSCSRRLIGPALSFFSNSDQLLTDVGLWSCGRRTASSKRSGKSTGFCRPPTRWWPERVFRSRLPHYNDGIVPCVAIRGSSPFIDCGFDARRTSHPVAGPERLAPQSLILEVIGLGRAGPPCISAYHSHCL